ncbi:hypothetical protein QFZ40_001793 [Arthrobacter pascens]|uniref:SRPBCC family protein n=1 Tax=Arthrobacter pascens TaxID=1677 RepID=UPI0027872C04|nr:SRPBCC family protein [Arthrobacter pascens]MDQ0633884.1 hypothetical protein [Arthrobacter pascens]
MPRVEADMDTPVPPERVRAALLDFSPGRPQVWPGIHPSLYEVYNVGETQADIREGSKLPGSTVWAKEHYDWSDPETVRWTVVESNFCAPGSYVSATITPNGTGGSRIHVIWNRTPTTLTGRIAAKVITATKGAPITRSIRKGLSRLNSTGNHT